MNNLEIRTKNRTTRLSYASCWDELSTKKYERVVSLLPKLKSTVESAVHASDPVYPQWEELLEKQRIEILFILLGIKWWIPGFLSSKKRAVLTLLPDEVDEILLSISWVLGENNRKKPPYPKIKVFGSTYHPPEDCLNNISAAEFHFADWFYQEWTQNKDKSFLNAFVATLYRKMGIGKNHNPKSPTFIGDIRERFNQFSVDTIQHKFKRLPQRKKEAIVHWYEGCRNEIAKANPHVFKSSKKETENTGIGSGWIPVFRSLREPLKKTFEEIESMRLSRVLMELKYIDDEIIEQKRKAALA